MAFATRLTGWCRSLDRGTRKGAKRCAASSCPARSTLQSSGRTDRRGQRRRVVREGAARAEERQARLGRVRKPGRRPLAAPWTASAQGGSATSTKRAANSDRHDPRPSVAPNPAAPASAPAVKAEKSGPSSAADRIGRATSRRRNRRGLTEINLAESEPQTVDDWRACRSVACGAGRGRGAVSGSAAVQRECSTRMSDFRFAGQLERYRWNDRSRGGGGRRGGAAIAGPALPA